MLNTIIEKVAAAVAVRVTQEILERLPDITEAIIDKLPDVAERIVEEILERLPFPFNR